MSEGRGFANRGGGSLRAGEIGAIDETQNVRVTLARNVRDVRVGRLPDGGISVSWRDDSAEEGETFMRWFDEADAERRIISALRFARDLYSAIDRHGS